MSSIDSTFATAVRETFYRAIDLNFREFAIAGSRSAGRYSRAHEPTLYLISSVDGVEAAMIAHLNARSAALEIVEMEVGASGIVDLRDASAPGAAGIDRAHAVAPWQDIAAPGGTPSSWMVRDRFLKLDANS